MFNNKVTKFPKVKLVAVAKDEAAYLPEWVHHHLYLGFDAIDIHINRTTDNSYAILQKISNKFPNVKAKNGDWVDLCPENARQHIQQIIYAQSLNEVRESNEFDYLMFIDIDEFWTPKNLKTKIGDIIQDLKRPDSISFQWFNEQGLEEDFSSIGREILGSRHKLVKSVFNIAAEIKGMSLHLPQMTLANKLLVDGKKFKPAVKHHEQLHPSLSEMRSCMIVHRMFRSPMEYVSLLNRGRPSKKLAIKTNRFGYNKESSEIELYQLDSKAYENYQLSFSGFLEKIAVSAEIKIAQKFVTDRYYKTLDAIRDVPIVNAKEVIRAFGNCNLETRNMLCKKYGSQHFIGNLKTPALLKDLAMAFEAVDIKVSYDLIKRARELHPTGPQIKQLFDQYLAKLNELPHD
ncbi:MAG: hypothetical protein ACJASL_001950 [Paraglaciecola sp.]|jgi:hypothetical protein